MSRREQGTVVAAAAVTGHLVANGAHGAAHSALGIDPPPGWLPFIVVVIFTAPVVGLAVARRWRIAGALLLASSMLASLAFGIAYHCVVDSVDRCDHVGEGAWASTFRVTAALLALTELGGIVAAMVIVREELAAIGAGVRRAVILVDGTCVFCNRLVRWILGRDRAGYFEFAHVQGALGRAALARQGIDPPDLDGVYVVLEPGTPQERLLVDGEAGRFIYPRILPLAGALAQIVPLPLLDLFYRAFARVRYRLFGQSEQCIVPTDGERARFVEA